MIGLRLRLLMLMVLLISVLAFGGCGEVEIVDSDDGWVEQVSAITEPMTGAELRVEFGETVLDVTGVVRVRVVIRWDDGVAVELIEPDWEGFGWVVGAESGSEIRFDGTGYERDTVFELWPYLPGEYEIPSIGIRASTETVGKRIARIQGIGVVVSSVLEEADTGELDAAVGLAEFVGEDEESSAARWARVGIVGASIGFVVACGMVIVWRRRGGVDDQRFDAGAFVGCAAMASEFTKEELGELHRAIVELSKEHVELNDLASEIEAIRFSGHEIEPRRVQETARRAAMVCGVSV